GNVLFEHAEAADAKLEARIEKVVKDRFGIDSFAAVRNEAELERAIDGNPFVADGEVKFVHTIFLSDALDREKFERFARDYPGPERLAAVSASSLSISAKASRVRSSTRRCERRKSCRPAPPRATCVRCGAFWKRCARTAKGRRCQSSSPSVTSFSRISASGIRGSRRMA